MTIDTTPITVNSAHGGRHAPVRRHVRALTVTTNVSIAPGGTLQTNTVGAQTGHTLIGRRQPDERRHARPEHVGQHVRREPHLHGCGEQHASAARALTTDLRTLTINKGTSNANILEITTSALSVQGTVVDGTPMAFLTITNGTLKISGSFVFAGRTFTAAAYSIPATGGFCAQQPELHRERAERFIRP